MFSGCSKLKKINLSNEQIALFITLIGSFEECPEELQIIDEFHPEINE